MNEIWKEIPEFEGRYEVSNIGRVRGMARVAGNRVLNQRVMPLTENQDGYYKISLYKNSKGKTFVVHRLVMLAFVGPSELQVDHINHDRKDNRLENLRYVTLRQNNSHLKGKKEGKYSSRYTGVTWKEGRWCSRITIDGKRKHLGYFLEEEEAAEAYNKALINV